MKKQVQAPREAAAACRAEAGRRSASAFAEEGAMDRSHVALMHLGGAGDGASHAHKMPPVQATECAL